MHLYNYVIIWFFIINYSLDLTITLDSPQLEGAEGATVLVCASISGNITLDIPSVSASLTIFRVEQSGMVRKSKYRIAGYFRGMYISRIATSILVHEN